MCVCVCEREGGVCVCVCGGGGGVRIHRFTRYTQHHYQVMTPRVHRVVFVKGVN